MLIRKATVEDAPEACDVLRRSITELCEADHRNDPKLLDPWLANKRPSTVAAWIANPDAHVFVAIDSGAIVGVGAVTSTGEITLNYVSPAARFRGVSKELLKELEAEALRRGNACVTLTSTRTAYQFYRSAGYQAQAQPADTQTPTSSTRMSKLLSG